MKILLAACNAKYIHSNLAVYDLKAYSSDYDKEVFLREYTINQPKDEILKDIYGSGADVVCFSCYIWNISFVRELIRDSPLNDQRNTRPTTNAEKAHGRNTID